MQRDEPENWTSTLWTDTLELHQQDFRATNVIDYDECFVEKTLETYMFLSLMSYSLNIYWTILTKLLMAKILHGCLDGIGTVSTNEKDNAWIC